MRAVLERDFLAESTSSKSFRARTYMAVMVATAVAVFLYSVADLLRRSPDEASHYVFRVGVGSLLALAALLTPAAAVSAVLTERVQQTLPLVLATPVGAIRFALAKLLARTGAVLFWTLSAIPPLALCVLLGGVSGGDLLRAGALVTGVVIELGAWAIFVSAFSSRLATAAVAAYLLPLLRWGGTAWWAWTEAERSWSPSMRNMSGATGLGEVLATLASTPVGGILHLVDREDTLALVQPPGGLFVTNARGVTIAATATAVPTPAPWGPIMEPTLWFLLTAVLMAVLLVILAGWRLRSEGEPRGSWIPRGKEAKKARRLRLPGTGNPVAWREARMVNTGSSRPLYYLTLLVLVIGSLAVMSELLDRNRFRTTTVAGVQTAEFLLMAAVAAVSAAAAVGHERTQGTWELLRVSPLTVRELVFGKYLGVVKGVAFLSFVPCCVLLYAWLTNRLTVGSALVSVAMSLVPLALWSAVGLRLGIRVRRPGLAVTATIMCFVTSFAVTVAAGNVAQWVGGELHLPGNPNPALRFASPWYALHHALVAVHGAPSWVEQRYWGRGGGDPGDWAIFWTAAHASLAVVLLAGAPEAMRDSLRREEEDG